MAAKKKSSSKKSSGGRKSRSPRKKRGQSSTAGARTMWKGSLSFGLVNIPVRMYSAIDEKNVRFHMFSEKDHCRVRQKLVCEGTDKKVERRNVVKGYETSQGRKVFLSDKELEKIAPKSERVIELIQFSDLDQIDPVYYSRPYYLLPEKSARKAYALFVQALEKSGKVGIAKFTLRKREYLITLRIVEHCLCLETMHFHDEVRRVENLPEAGHDVSVKKKEVDTAEQLINSLSEDFDPVQFQDEYRERVLELIRKKGQGKKVEVQEEPEEEEAEVVDLMSALEASLKKSKKSKKKAA